MRKLTSVITALGLVTVGSVAQACTTAAWNADGATVGSVVTAGPGDAVPANQGVPRYAGGCSLLATGAGHVRTQAMAAETRVISRYYFFTSGSGTATIGQAYSDDAGVTPVYTVSYNGTNVTVTPASGTAASAAVGATGWHSLEVDWNSGGAINIWVDIDSSGPASDAGTDTTSASIESVAIGAIGGTGGFTQVIVDDFVAQRTTAVGRLTRGDATGDSNVNIFDAISTVNEVLGNSFSTGTPDCNEDGSVNIFDAICIVNIVLGN